MAVVQIVFHSIHGHVHRLAEAVAEGARSVAGTEVRLHRVPEFLPEDALRSIGAEEAQQAMADIPVASPDMLASADAVLVGTPTRFGNMSFQMRAFWDNTVQLWLAGALVGKIGSVFTAIGTQHGGHESTPLTVYSTFIHHGMIVVGVPYTVREIMEMGEITGGGPYGASTMSNVDGSRPPSANELKIGFEQGRRVAEIAAKLARPG
jgi:NAD(P)H dehydrogenase (quinone)